MPEMTASPPAVLPRSTLKETHGFFHGSSTRLETSNNAAVLSAETDPEIESLDDSFHSAHEEPYRMVTTMRKYNKTHKNKELAKHKVNYFESKGRTIQWLEICSIGPRR